MRKLFLSIAALAAVTVLGTSGALAQNTEQ
jgi:hypothetical protein